MLKKKQAYRQKMVRCFCAPIRMHILQSDNEWNKKKNKPQIFVKLVHNMFILSTAIKNYSVILIYIYLSYLNNSKSENINLL